MPQNAPWEYDPPVGGGSDAAPWENDRPVESQPASKSPYGPAKTGIGTFATQGASFGFADEAASAALAGTVGAAKGVYNAVRERDLGAIPKAIGDEYTALQQSQREGRQQFRQEHPGQALGAEIAGGFASGGVGVLKAGAKAGIGAAAGTGAIQGGLYGAGSAEGNLAERTPSAAGGAAIGAAGGAGLQAFASKAASFLKLRGTPAKAPEDAKRALGMLRDAMAEDLGGRSKAEAALRVWLKSGGKPEQLFDIAGPYTQSLAREIASQKPTPALQFINRLKDAQSQEIRGQIASSINKKGGSVEAARLALETVRKEQASPAYQEAFKNDPLKIVEPGPAEFRQANDWINQADELSKSAEEIKGRVADLKRQESRARGNFDLQRGLQESGSVGQVEGSRSSFSEAMRSRLKFDRVAKDLEDRSDLLKKKAANLLEPRASRELLALIERRPALKRAIQIARVKVANRGAALQKDGIPTMEVLDRAKGVLDDEIGRYYSRNAKRDAGDILAVKNEFLRLLDEANPEYGAARKIYAGTAEIEDALETGKEFLKPSYTADQLAKDLADMGESAREFHKVQVAEEFAALVDKTRDGSNKGAFIANEAMRKKIRILFQDDPNEGEAFINLIQRSEERFRRLGEIDPKGGSQTEPRLRAKEIYEQNVAGPIERGTQTVLENPAAAPGKAFKAGANKLRGDRGKRISQILAEILFEGAPNGLQSATPAQVPYRAGPQANILLQNNE